MKIQEFQLNAKVNFRNFIISPFLSGLLGYAIFFTILLASKAICVVVGTIPHFIIEFGDMVMSFLGFVFLLLIKFLKNYEQKRTRGLVEINRFQEKKINHG